MSHLPLDMWRLISLNLPLKDILSLRLVCADLGRLLLFWNNYNQIKLGNLITNSELRYFTGYTNLNLTECGQITDQGLSYLSNCVKLDLSYCCQITDKGLNHIDNCTDLDLKRCNRITDGGLKYLGNCTELNLSGCCRISNKDSNISVIVSSWIFLIVMESHTKNWNISLIILT